MQHNLEVEVFRAGDYGPKGVWSEQELDQIAGDYDAALHEAPVTLDHAQRGPALGWVEALRRVGDRLVARLRGLNVKLLELIRQGAFKKRSIELYPALRETGRPYLRAVSFLGAAAPEVKGLADPLPPEDAAAPLFAEPAEPSLVFEETFDTAGEFASERTGAEESGSSARERQPHFVSFAEVAERLRTSGKWHPAWSGRGIEEFYRALAAVDEIEVGEGQCVSPAQWFADFLESLPPLVAMDEAAPSLKFFENAAGPYAPNIDPASAALHRAVLAFRQAHKGVSYSEALTRCAGRV